MNIQHNLEDIDEFAIRGGCSAETFANVQHYTDRLFRFRTPRPVSLRLCSGEFVRLACLAIRQVFVPNRFRLRPEMTRWNFSRSSCQMVC